MASERDALPPIARSDWECQTFLTLVACPTCQTTGFEPTGFSATDPPEVIWTYDVECLSSRHEHTFEFMRGPEPEPPYPVFGGQLPSQLIDAGQFLRFARGSAELAPADPAELIDARAPDLTLAEAFEEIRTAVAAVREALKFVPAGAADIPREALWTDESTAWYDREPERFHRRQLIAALGVLTQVESSYAMVIG
jgi:hypothetical protein